MQQFTAEKFYILSWGFILQVQSTYCRWYSTIGNCYTFVQGRSSLAFNILEEVNSISPLNAGQKTAFPVMWSEYRWVFLIKRVDKNRQCMIRLKYTQPELLIVGKYISLYHLHGNCLQIFFKTDIKWFVKVCQVHNFSVVELIIHWRN